MRNFLALIIIAFILTSCTTGHFAVKNYHEYGQDPIGARSFIELTLDDIEYLGEIEVSYEYSKYLGFITRLIAINGEHPDNGEIHYATLPLGPWQTLTTTLNPFMWAKDDGMHRALYKVYTEFPNYDYIEVHSTNVKTHRMFLGRKTKKTILVKAYRYKY